MTGGRKPERLSFPGLRLINRFSFLQFLFPVTMPKPSSEEKSARLSHGGMIEIEIDGALIRVSSRADKETLRFVLAELRRAP